MCFLWSQHFYFLSEEENNDCFKSQNKLEKRVKDNRRGFQKRGYFSKETALLRRWDVLQDSLVSSTES